MTPDSIQRKQQLIGESLSFSLALQQVSRIAPLNKPVLIVGERGTGKELIAARIHYLSTRWDQAFLQLNCAAISDSLQESELFGHESGAFTGATRRRIGRFERAHGGSLFLDELATTSQRVQEQLLRVIEYGEYERLGGQETLTTDVRIIAATNEDLPSLAEQGKFRYDLLDRLAFDIITLPPLRHRLDDIPILADYFATNMTTELGQPVFPGFTDQALELLRTHHWPGNVRELKNTIDRSLYRHPDWSRPVSDIHIDPFESPFRPVPKHSTAARPDNALNRQPAGSPPQFSFPLQLKGLVKDLEVAAIEAAMQRARYNQTHAAELLGLTYHQLRAYLKKYRSRLSMVLEPEA